MATDSRVDAGAMPPPLLWESGFQLRSDSNDWLDLLRYVIGEPATVIEAKFFKLALLSVGISVLVSCLRAAVKFINVSAESSEILDGSVVYCSW